MRSRRRHISRQGFTLTEVLITVMIIAILAAVALPTYGRAVEQANWNQARDVLRAIYGGERTYFNVNSTYIDPTAGGNTWNMIYMDNPASPAITYNFPTITAATFTAQATRNGGRCAGATMTITDTQLFNGTWSTGAGVNNPGTMVWGGASLCQ